MNLDLSDVPESTVLAVHRLIYFADQNVTGEVRINMHDGGVTEFHDPPHDKSDLKALAAKENGR